MPNRRVVQESTLRRTYLCCIVLISVMLVSYLLLPKTRASDLTSNARIGCLDLKEVRYLNPQSYPENSIGGVQVGFDERTGKLQIHASFPKDIQQSLSVQDGFFESDDGGETLKVLATPNSVMSEHVDLWPPPPTNQRFRYRTIGEPVATPYYDHLGLRQEIRWFIEKSEDAGKTWNRANGRIANSCESIDRFILRGYHPVNPNTFYISARIIGSKVLAGLFVTKDGGNSFELLLVGWSLVHFAVSHSNPSIMYATNECGSVVKSENAGAQWRVLGQDREMRELIVSDKQNNGTKEIVIPDGNDIHRIEIDPTDAERVYVLSKKGILRTKDGGKNWCVLNLGPGVTTAANSVAIDPKRPNWIFAGTWAGLYRSKDGGDNWEKVYVSERLAGK